MGDDGSALLAWCVSANVHGSDGHGTRHFSVGTKVWVMRPQWGDGGEDLLVVGRHRGTPGGYVRMVVPRAVLSDFRVRGVYSPAVAERLRQPWRDDGMRPLEWASREEAQQAVDLWTAAPPGGDGGRIRFDARGRAWQGDTLMAEGLASSARTPPRNRDGSRVTVDDAQRFGHTLIGLTEDEARRAVERDGRFDIEFTAEPGPTIFEVGHLTAVVREGLVVTVEAG